VIIGKAYDDGRGEAKKDPDVKALIKFNIGKREEH